MIVKFLAVDSEDAFDDAYDFPGPHLPLEPLVVTNVSRYALKEPGRYVPTNIKQYFGPVLRGSSRTNLDNFAVAKFLNRHSIVLHRR